MKFLLGFLMIIGGIALGLYVGLWLCFVGGIIGIINAIATVVNGSPIEAMTIAISIVKIIFAAVLGWISALILIIPGVALLK